MKDVLLRGFEVTGIAVLAVLAVLATVVLWALSYAIPVGVILLGLHIAGVI